MTKLDLDEAERMFGDRMPAHEDADVVAHARTFVPAAVARIRELEAALAKYGAHIGYHETGRGPACSRRDGSECDCGLDAALGRQR